MKAAFLYGINDLRLEEIPIPVISENEILIKNHFSFVCGTDIRMLMNGNTNVAEGKSLIIGHEFAGIIEKVGSNIKEYNVGEKVLIAPNIGCGTCIHCISGNSHNCSEYQAFGVHFNGGFAEFTRIPKVAVERRNVIKLKDSMSLAEAALIEPFSCVYNGYERAKISPGDSVLIQGAGPIGIMHAKLAKMAGATKVMVSDIHQERLDIVKTIDPFFITILSDKVKDKVRYITNGKGVDVSIIACPSVEAQILSIELGAVNGRIIFFGGLPESKQFVSLNTNAIHYKQLILSGTSKSSLSQIYKSINLVESGVIRLNDIITTLDSIENIHSIFDKAINGNGLKFGVSF